MNDMNTVPSVLRNWREAQYVQEDDITRAVKTASAEPYYQWEHICEDDGSVIISVKEN
jgi:hypothetical protein